MSYMESYVHQIVQIDDKLYGVECSSDCAIDDKLYGIEISSQGTNR
jgi:hypothetical protein